MSADRDEEFVQLVAECQRRLYAYILQLVPSRSDAQDVLGETNLALWRKREEFTPGTSFNAWASKFAYFEVLAFRKRQQRDRLHFDDDLISQIAAEAASELDVVDSLSQTLADCVQKLSHKDRDLLQRRYGEGLLPQQIAASVGRSARAVAQALYRVRELLAECMDLRARKGELAP